MKTFSSHRASCHFGVHFLSCTHVKPKTSSHTKFSSKLTSTNVNEMIYDTCTLSLHSRYAVKAAGHLNLCQGVTKSVEISVNPIQILDLSNTLRYNAKPHPLVCMRNTVATRTITEDEVQQHSRGTMWYRMIAGTSPESRAWVAFKPMISRNILHTQKQGTALV